jgi:hypothetical protein
MALSICWFAKLVKFRFESQGLIKSGRLLLLQWRDSYNIVIILR